MSIYTKDMPNVVDDPHTVIGDYTYGGISIARAYDGAISKLNIGKFCSLGSGILMAYYGSHQLSEITTYPFFGLHGKGWDPVTSIPVNGQDINIGSDVYIANHAVIMQGANIGDGVVIGAYSVCKTKIPPYCIAVGNPCKVIRQRFPDEQIKKLLEMKWWDWPIKKIKEHLQVISSPDVEKLYDIWEKEIK